MYVDFIKLFYYCKFILFIFVSIVWFFDVKDKLWFFIGNDISWLIWCFNIGFELGGFGLGRNEEFIWLECFIKVFWILLMLGWEKRELFKRVVIVFVISIIIVIGEFGYWVKNGLFLGKWKWGVEVVDDDCLMSFIRNFGDEMGRKVDINWVMMDVGNGGRG